MIKFRCPNCRGELEAPESAAGQTAACPACKSVVQVPPLLPEEAAPAGPAQSPRSGARPAGRISGLVPMIVSVVALLAAGAALFLTLIQKGHVPGKGMKAYDFGTPQGAIRSRLEMEKDGEILGFLEYQASRAKAESDKSSTKLDTLKFEKTMEADGKVVVLYKYKEDGKDRRRAEWFDKKGGLYYPTYVPTYNWIRESGEKANIAKAIADWVGREEP